jgi:two-component system, chemotaxis family, protein-glutamate methylesterase/glutaminase
MEQPGHSIVVIGTSAGGMGALERLLVQLPENLPAALFIVQHLGIDSSAEFLMSRLNKFTGLTCVVARHNDSIRKGTVYMAPADKHLLLKQDKLLVAKGPRENQFRPSIDPLFRSAAAHYGSQVISVILTGFMNDGVAGTDAVRRAGGVTIVQDPADAEFPDLPRNVLRHIHPHYQVPISEMGALITRLASQPAPDSITVPQDIKLEADLAERVMTKSNMTNIEDLEKLGNRSPYSCPECGGGLWELTREGGVHRFRCHSGHAYTTDSLIAGMNEALEETLWIAMRTLEERRTILLNMASQTTNGNSKWTQTQRERAEEMKVHIERIRAVLQQSSVADTEEKRMAG